MAAIGQANRPLVVAPKDTSLKNALLPVGFSGEEAVSQLFHFRLDLLAENDTAIPFEKLLGQPVTVGLTLADGKTRRFFHGLCNRFSQGARDATFTAYRMDVVPQLWLLTR